MPDRFQPITYSVCPAKFDDDFVNPEPGMRQLELRLHGEFLSTWYTVASNEEIERVVKRMNDRFRSKEEGWENRRFKKAKKANAHK